MFTADIFLYITHNCLMHHVFEAKSPEAMAKPEDVFFFPRKFWEDLSNLINIQMGWNHPRMVCWFK